MLFVDFCFFFKQKTAYEMRISDWSSDVCSSDLQYNTISKPSEIVAAAAANVAVKLLNGETPEAETTLFNTPSQLFVPVVVTRDNIKAEIFDKGIASAADICTGRYAEGCAELGIQ